MLFRCIASLGHIIPKTRLGGGILSDSLPLRVRSSDLRFALSDGQPDRPGGEPRTFVPCPFVRLARDGETMTGDLANTDMNVVGEAKEKVVVRWAEEECREEARVG